MKKTLCMVAVIVLALITASTSFGYEALTGPSGVLRYNKANSYGGYTVFAPMLGCKTTYLIDMEGNLVHQWESEYPPGLFAMLLPNGNLLRGGSMKQAGDVSIGGAGGIVQEIDWDSKVVWEYKMNSETELQHHCFDRMPNGNTLILGWEAKSLDEVLAKGRDPKSFLLQNSSEANATQNSGWILSAKSIKKEKPSGNGMYGIMSAPVLNNGISISNCLILLAVADKAIQPSTGPISTPANISLSMICFCSIHATSVNST